jgi:hypothetical protein
MYSQCRVLPGEEDRRAITVVDVILYLILFASMPYLITCPLHHLPPSASFSALGVLVCFGGASLCLSSTTGPERGRKKNPFHTPMPYPKTLADLLVAERMRAEQIAVRASEEAEVSEGDFRKFNLSFLKFLSISLKARSEGEEGEEEGRGEERRQLRSITMTWKFSASER